MPPLVHVTFHISFPASSSSIIKLLPKNAHSCLCLAKDGTLAQHSIYFHKFPLLRVRSSGCCRTPTARATAPAWCALCQAFMYFYIVSHNMFHTLIIYTSALHPYASLALWAWRQAGCLESCSHVLGANCKSCGCSSEPLSEWSCSRTSAFLRSLMVDVTLAASRPLLHS